jgi:CDGSH-type Zn-finger protein
MTCGNELPNLLTIGFDGPNFVSGNLVVATPARTREMNTAVLCRCGYSSDKPFCDGAHVKIGFADRARLPADVVTGIASSGRLTITPLPNGPNRCEGPLTIRDADGRTSTATTTRLCRCGGSQTKPYCDGTHKKNGFVG